MDQKQIVLRVPRHCVTEDLEQKLVYLLGKTDDVYQGSKGELQEFGVYAIGNVDEAVAELRKQKLPFDVEYTYYDRDTLMEYYRPENGIMVEKEVVSFEEEPVIKIAALKAILNGHMSSEVKVKQIREALNVVAPDVAELESYLMQEERAGVPWR